MRSTSFSDKELRELKITPYVKRDGKGHIDFYDPNVEKWWYWIEEKEVNSRRGLIRFIHHLSGKNWITTRHIMELIQVSGQMVGKKVYD